MLLTAKHIVKSFHGEPVLRGLDFSLEKHHTLSILGRSGCGKTTLLKIIAGLETADEGTILLNDVSINSLSPNKRNIVYIYQESLLFPHLTVFENIAFGLRLRKESKDIIKQKVNDLLQHLSLEQQAKKMPQQLSGGQKQRVSFGRALIINPPLLLLDEPFGNLDTTTRSSMQELFKNIAKEYGISAIFVTHDLKEAMIMGDEMALMKKGELKTYPDKISFINDSSTGVQEELQFWENLNKGDDAKGV